MELSKTTWKVKTEEGSVELDSSTLLETLLGKVLSSPKKDFDELIVNFGRFLQSRDLFGDMKFNQLIGMSFAVGYFYRIFLEKNEVEISIVDNSNNQNNDESGDQEKEKPNEMDSEPNTKPSSQESSSSAS